MKNARNRLFRQLSVQAVLLLLLVATLLFVVFLRHDATGIQRLVDPTQGVNACIPGPTPEVIYVPVNPTDPAPTATPMPENYYNIAWPKTVTVSPTPTP